MADSTSSNTSGSSGSSLPFFKLPEKSIGSAYGQVTQPIQGILNPYQIGITDTVSTRNATNDLIQSYGEGQRARINQDFSTAANNAAGRLAGRGFGGSSLQLTEAMAVERDRNLALGELNDRVIGTQLGNSLNYAQLIAQQTGQSGDASVSLMRALLGLTNQTNSSASGGSSRSDGQNRNSGGGQQPTQPIDYGYQDYADGVSGGGQQSGGGGGGSGGGGSGGGGSGGGGPAVISNPYFPGDGDNVTEGSEIGKDWPAVPPTGPVPLIPGDKGPRLTPEIYAENQKRITEASAQGRKTVFGHSLGGNAAGAAAM